MPSSLLMKPTKEFSCSRWRKVGTNKEQKKTFESVFLRLTESDSIEISRGNFGHVGSVASRCQSNKLYAKVLIIPIGTAIDNCMQVASMHDIMYMTDMSRQDPSLAKQLIT